jgi:hypothetical protein
LSDKGYSAEFGARPLRRLIQNEVEETLSDGLLSGQFVDNTHVLIDAVDGKLTFTQVNEVSGSADDVTIREVVPAPKMLGEPDHNSPRMIEQMTN